MEGGSTGGKFLVLLLVLWLFILDVVLLAVGADAFNRFVDGTLTGTNGITQFVVLFALIEGTFLAAAVVLGLSHAFHYHSGSVGPAFATAVIAWGVDILALGLAAKEIHIGGVGPREKAIEAFIIIIAFFETVYVLILASGLHVPKSGVAYGGSQLPLWSGVTMGIGYGIGMMPFLMHFCLGPAGYLGFSLVFSLFIGSLAFGTLSPDVAHSVPLQFYIYDD